MTRSIQSRQTNRWGAWVLTFLTILVLPCMAYAAPDISVTSVSGAPGSSVSVSVIADFSVAVNSIQFQLQFDPKLLNATSVTAGSGNSSWVVTSNPNNTTGTVNVAMFNVGGSALSASGSQKQIAVINFTVNNPPGDSSTSDVWVLSNIDFDAAHNVPQVDTSNAFTLIVVPVNYTLTVNVSGNGSVTESVNGVTTTATSFQSGTVVQLLAVPTNGNSEFSDWSEGASGSANPLNVTIGGDTTILANFSATAAPTMTTQPVSLTLTAPATATFTAAATGTPTPTYQWQVSTNGGASFSNIGGATSGTYTITPTTTSLSGNEYRCVASNGVSPAATSNAATLTVNAAQSAPVITTQPVSVTLVAPATATFTAAATGTPTPTYQWQVSTNGGANFSSIGGATSGTYTITPTTTSLSGNEYRCVASNGVSPAATSNAATLTVSATPVAPSITTQPGSLTLTAPATATFTAAATGTPTPTYQWQVSTNGGASFSNIGGATSGTYTITPTTTSLSGNEYRCVASNGVSPAATSNAAILTVNVAQSAPVITVQPASETVTAPGPATFTVTATSVPAPTFQWQKSTDGGVTFNNYGSATTATLTTASSTYNIGVSVADNGSKFRCIVTNGVSPAATSNVATLTVNPTPTAPVITTQPVSVTVLEPGTVIFTAAATGTPTPTYQWQVSTNGGASFSNISGATSGTYTITSTTTSLSGNEYRCVASNGVSPAATSNAATLTVNTTVYTITASAGANGSISPSGAVPVDYESSQMFTVSPAQGYNAALTVDGLPATLTNNTYTFSNVKTSHTIFVSFSLQTETITASSGANGRISPSGSVTVNSGASQIFTIIPNSSAYMGVLTVDGLPATLTNNTYTFNDVTTAHKIAVNFILQPETITATAGPNGSISPSGTPTVNWGSSQTFTFTPNPGYGINQVLVDNVVVKLSSPNSYTLSDVTTAHTIAVSFVPSYIISASAGTGGTISPSGAVNVNTGLSQKFTITASSGYNINEVLVDNVAVTLAAGNTYTLSNVTAAHTITASFIPSYTITSSSGANGRINPSGAVNVNNGASQTFTVTPNSVAYMPVLTVDGLPATLTNNTYTFSDVTTTHKIAVNFILQPETITATAEPNGSISPSGATVVNWGSSQTFTFTPNTGYSVYQVMVDNVVVKLSSPNSYTLTSVTGNHTIVVNFIQSYIVSATAETGGTISPSGAVSVDYGSSQKFTVTASKGYNINEVLVDNVPVTLAAGNTYTINDVTAAHTITASFIPSYTITSSSGANGRISPSGAISVNNGASQTFTVTPNSVAYMPVLTVDGLPATLTNNTYTFSDVETAHTIAVTFILQPETITATAGANGSINPAGAVVVNWGSSKTFNFIPNTGYSVYQVLVDNAPVTVSSNNSYTLSSVTGNHTIAVSFVQSYVVTASAGTGGAISPSGAVNVDTGANQKFTITPTEGYGINEVLVDNVPVTLATGNTYTINDVTAPHTIAASFVLSYPLIASSGANGRISPAGIVIVNSGATQTFTVTPNSSVYEPILTVDGLPVTLTNNTYTFSDVTSAHVISVRFVLKT